MSNINWFEKWFDSSYYPILYQHRDYTEASKFIEKLMNSLSSKEIKTILDLACGEGRHSIHLHKLGFEVQGIDLSKRSIEIASKKSSAGLAFSVADMRNFHLDQKFDLILNLFTSFGYFEDLNDNIKVLKRVYDHLQPKGTFVIDFFNPYKVIRELIPYESKIINQVLFLINKDINEEKIIKKISIYDQNSKFTYFEKVQLIFPETFEKILADAGFRTTKLYGDYSLNKYDPNNSDRLIIFAEK